MKKIKLKTLRRKLDKIFSKYIVKRDHNICVTCMGAGNQAGHFISRVHYSTRWNPKNVHCQCVRCNIFLHGNLIYYFEFMLAKYGMETIDILKKKSLKTLKPNKEFYLTKIKEYSNI